MRKCFFAGEGRMQNAKCKVQNESPVTSDQSPGVDNAVGVGAFDGPLFPPVGAVIGRPREAEACQYCHCETSAHTGCGNPHPLVSIAEDSKAAVRQAVGERIATA